ncbi:MAG: hypothetical protein AB8G26_05405 [Ilumatobacter sp.]
MAGRSLTLTSLDDRPVVGLCAGKDCRKRCEFAKIRDELDVGAHVVELGCVGICSGPVVAAAVGGRVEVFSKVRKKSQRKELQRLVEQDRGASKELRSRRVTGSKRDKAARRLARALR